jgi:hypothetical protein
MRIVLLLVALLLAGGCGVRPSGVIRGVPAPNIELGDGTALYLVYDGKPVLTVRGHDASSAPTDALTLLAAGPTPDERERGLTSEVPADAVPVAVADSRNLVTITLSTNVSTLSVVAVQQIACTVATGTPVIVAGGGERRGPLSCPR